MIFNPSKAFPSFDPNSMSQVFDDFWGGWIDAANGIFNSANQWRYAQTNSGLQMVSSGITDKPGRLQLQNGGTAANDFVGVGLSYISWFFGVPAKTTIKFSLANGQAALADFDQRIGLLSNPSAAGEPGSGIYFRAVGAGNWFAICRNGGVETTVDTTIAQSTTYKNFRIEIPAVATSATFFINDVQVAMIATNTPAAGVVLILGMKNDATAIIGAANTNIDFAFYLTIGLTR